MKLATGQTDTVLITSKSISSGVRTGVEGPRGALNGRASEGGEERELIEVETERERERER